MRWLMAIGAAAGLVLVNAGHAADLEVTITGVRSAGGVVRLALYDRAEGFATEEAVAAAQVVPAARGAVRAVFEGLGAGIYAIAAYHDEDNDDKFDRFLLIPREGYGFSNDVRPGLRAPTFDEAAFNVPPGGIAVSFAFSGAT